MIAHFSMPAARPRETAEFFARIIDGVAMPFPVVEGAWIAIARDGSGTAVEVVPETTAIERDGRYQPGLRDAPAETSAIHFALTTALSMAEVIEMGVTRGWQTEHCNRGPFDLVEIWVDNRQMIEVLPPESAARYLAFARPEAALEAFAAMAA
ncbi:MAG TPA: hypothetical protein PLF78_05605 [Caulobacter sp.]|nr:hypothetical protein [Caulobacter sp.]